MPKRIVVAFLVASLLSCEDNEEPSLGTATPRISSLEQEARKLLDQHSRLEARYLNGTATRSLSEPMRDLDRQLADMGEEILGFHALRDAQATRPEGEEIRECTVTPIGALPLSGVWRRFVELQRREAEARGRLVKSTAARRPARACTPSAELMDLLQVSGSLHEVRNALKSAYGVTVAHPR